MEEALKEIIDFISRPGISYYDLKQYAYDNDKDDWIKCLKSKKRRGFISMFIRSRRRKDGVKYQNGYAESVIRAGEAQVKYKERKEPF